MKRTEDNQFGRFLDTVTATPHRGGGYYYYQMLELCRARLLLIWIMMGLAFLGLGVRIVLLPFLSISDLSNRNASQVTETLRSDIIDRHGKLLASAAIIKSLNAEVPLMIRANVDFDEATQKLVALFPSLDPQKLRDKFRRLSHFPIRNRLTPEQVWQVRQLGIPGIYTLRKEGRIYPFAEMTAHLVGFVDNENLGQSGVELKFNSFLSKGEESLQLSIDIRMQYILTHALQEAFQVQGAKSACGVIMAVDSAEIMAMASFPTYNPHDVASITPDKYFNCVTQPSYELGSTFKLITAAMGLESGVATLETIYDTTRPIRHDGKVISDLHLSAYPYSLKNIIVHSSNIGAALIARDVGGVRQREFLAKLGLLEMLPIELEGKSKPIIGKKITELSTMTIGFGHGIAVSPMHLASAVSGIINDGILRQPTLLHIPELSAKSGLGHRVVSSEVSRAVRQMMYLVVKEGTGRNARIPGYNVGGKTGTAEKLVETSLGLQYSADFSVSSFLGAFPMHQPKYLIYLVLDDPKGKNQSGIVGGARVVAPVVKAIIQQMIPFTHVAFANEKNVAVQKGLGFLPMQPQESR